VSEDAATMPAPPVGPHRPAHADPRPRGALVRAPDRARAGRLRHDVDRRDDRIVVILVHESKDFFAQVSLREFLGSTKWTPIIGDHPSYGVWPLLSATLTTAAIALAVAVPLGLLAAIYLSEYAAPRTRASSSRRSSCWPACRRSSSATSRSRR
jgi:hypothetical protein